VDISRKFAKVIDFCAKMSGQGWRGVQILRGEVEVDLGRGSDPAGREGGGEAVVELRACGIPGKDAKQFNTNFYFKPVLVL